PQPRVGPVVVLVDRRRVVPQLPLQLAADALQLPQQHHAVGRPAGGVLLQQLHDQGVDVVGDLGDEPLQPFGDGVAVLVQQLGGVVAGERRPAAEQAVEHAAERVEVAALGGGLAAGVLGGEVGGGADEAAGGGQ